MANKPLLGLTNIDMNKAGSILGQAEVFMLFFVFFKDTFMPWNFYFCVFESRNRCFIVLNLLIRYNFSGLITINSQRPNQTYKFLKSLK